MMKRAHLRQFLAVVDAGSFTRAAERVGIAQPSLSAGIAELERVAGARLFVRERRRIRLTEAGNRLLVHARAIEREFRAAEADLAGAPPTLAPARLGVIASLATADLARIAVAWQGGRELVLVEGSDSDLRKRLAEGQLDAVLGLLRPEDRDRPHVELRDEPYRVMLAAGHPLAVRDELDASDVAGETMIARRSCEILSETSRFFTRRGVRPSFFLRSANEDRCMEMVRIGMGITTAPESLARPGIVAVPLAGYEFRRSVGLLFARHGGQTLDGARLATAIAEACREGLARADLR